MKTYLLITVSLILLLLFTALAALHFYITPERLVKFANTNLDDNLEAEIGSASFNPFTRSLNLGDVTLSAIRADQKVPIFHAEELKAGTIGLRSARKGNLSLNNLTADRFFLDLTILPDPTTTTYSGRSAATVEIGAFNLQNGELRFPAGNDGRGVLYDLQIIAGPLVYDPELETEPRSLFRDLDLQSERLEYQFLEERYLFTAESLSLSERDSTFITGRVSLSSPLSEIDFFDSFQYRKELIEIEMSGFQIRRMDLPSWLQSGDLIAGTVTAEAPDLQITMNKKYPIDPDRLPKPLPQHFLRNLPVTISLDSLLLHDADIRYSEYNEDGVRPGTVHFADSELLLLKVSNRPGDIMQLNAQSLLQGTGVFETEIRFLTETVDIVEKAENAGIMDSARIIMDTGMIVGTGSMADASAMERTEAIENARAIVTVTGTLIDFDLTHLNSLLMDLEGLEITGGSVRNLRFDYRLTESGSSGRVQVQYDGFTMNSVNRDDYSQNLGDHISGVINRIVMRSSSGSGGDGVREGVIETERDPERSFFNYLWVSLRSGLLDVAGRF